VWSDPSLVSSRGTWVLDGVLPNCRFLRLLCPSMARWNDGSVRSGYGAGIRALRCETVEVPAWAFISALPAIAEMAPLNIRIALPG
jgi:hypothetical protein